MYSDVHDLMVWLDDLSAPQSQMLSDASRTEMLTAQTPMASFGYQYGFGVVVDEVGGHKRIWHDGFEIGYVSVVSAIPDLEAKIVILRNRHDQAI